MRLKIEYLALLANLLLANLAMVFLSHFLVVNIIRARGLTY